MDKPFVKNRMRRIRGEYSESIVGLVVSMYSYLHIDVLGPNGEVNVRH